MNFAFNSINYKYECNETKKFCLTDCACKEDLKIVEAIAEHDFRFKRLPEMFAQWKAKIFVFAAFIFLNI